MRVLRNRQIASRRILATLAVNLWMRLARETTAVLPRSSNQSTSDRPDCAIRKFVRRHPRSELSLRLPEECHLQHWRRQIDSQGLNALLDLVGCHGGPHTS